MGHDLVRATDAPATAADAVQEIEAATADLHRLQVEAAAIVTDEQSSSTDLVVTQQSPARMKASMAALRSKVMRKQGEIQRKQEEIRKLNEALAERLREQMQVAEEIMGPLQELVKRLEEGIWTVNLYLGRDEQILTLADGEPAPADEPLVIRQMVLAMDEECAIDPEEEGIDSRDIARFDEWLLADPAHLTQMLPDVKGVVAIVPRYASKDYGDSWVNKRQQEEDAQTYFLIRNGGKLFRLWTNFNVGRKLVPTADEFNQFFTRVVTDYETGRKTREPLKPGSQAWLDAEKDSDARQRHYMRVALILQGLIDRTPIFHPLPEWGLDMMDRKHYLEGRVRFATDMENALTTGREPFRAWQRRLNGELRKGMRIIGAFDASGFYSHRDRDIGGNWRLTPRQASYPTSRALHTIEELKAGYFVIRYKRTDTIYKSGWVESTDRPGWGHRGGYVTPTRRASCRLEPSDDFIIAFDLATVPEMETYLSARLDRHEYVAMFPVLKAAIRAKREEAAAEAPFRTMLAGVLARDNGVDLADAEAAVDDLVRWWKFTLKNHRPLVGSEDEQAKAVRAIVAEHARRIKAARRGSNPKVVAALREAHRNALLIGRRRSGRYVVLCPQNDADVFVTRHEYTARGMLVETVEWKLLTQAQIAALTVEHEGDRLAGWDLRASLSEHLTDPEIDILAEHLKGMHEDGMVALAYNPEKRVFYTWVYGKDAVVTPERPLSGEQVEVAVDEWEYAWKRSAGHDVKLTRAWRSSRSNYSGQVKPWIVPDDSHYKWAKYRLLYLDEALDARVEAQKASYKAVADVRNEMLSRVRAAEQSIAAAWLKREEGRLYAKFIDDYADPTLWEGHKKTLRIDYPHSTHRDTLLTVVLRRLVEEGIPFDGLTVAEAVALAKAQPYFLIPPHTSPIPDDILGLRFALPKPDPEPDDREDLLDGGTLRFTHN